MKDLDAVIDFRTAAFDLDNVYGRGKDDQPYCMRATSSCSARRSSAALRMARARTISRATPPGAR